MDWVMEKMVLISDLTLKGLSRQKCREGGHQFQAEGTAG